MLSFKTIRIDNVSQVSDEDISHENLEYMHGTGIAISTGRDRMGESSVGRRYPFGKLNLFETKKRSVAHEFVRQTSICLLMFRTAQEAYAASATSSAFGNFLRIIKKHTR